jgi:restriction endonuclease S subunit
MKLENFCEVKTGIPINRYLENSENLDIKYLNLKSIINFRINKEYLVEGKLKKEINQLYYTKEKDILIKLAEPNDVVLIGKDDTGLVITQYFAIIRVTNKEIDPGYLAHILNSKKIKQEYKRKLEGGSISILKLNILKELEIKFPKLEEQIKLRKFWDLLVKKSQLMERQKDLFEVWKGEVINN